MALLESTNKLTGTLRRVWRNAGIPTNGAAGTLVDVAEPGDLLIDTTNTTLYQNTNTQASPTWTQLAASGAALSIDAADMAANGTSTANALGSETTAAPIDHVHKVGEHDHSGATKGSAVVLAALAADFFTADADGRGKFQTDLLDAATLTDLVADDGITNAVCDAKFAASAFAADADSRLVFADGIWNAAKLGSDAVETLKIKDANVTTAKLAAGVLSADADGRAKVATDFFNAATVAAKFATDSLDATACADIIEDNAIPSGKVNWSYGGVGDIVTIVPDASADTGSEAGVARIDHTHAIATAAPSGSHVPDCSDAEGSSNSFTRADHVHALTCAAPSAGIAAADAEGNATSFARSNHVHKATIINDTFVVGRNNADDGDVNVWKVNASDQIELGADLNAGVQNVITTGYVSIGATVADSGGIRIPNNTYLALARNAANGANVSMWKVNASDQIEAGATVTLGSNNLITTGYVSIGTNPAAAGTVRLPNATYLVARNAANNADINMVEVDASDHVLFGVSVGATTFAGTVSMADQKVDFTTGYAEFGTTPASAGAIRQENDVVVWAARNAGDDGDISGWKINAEDDYEAAADVNLGGNKLYGGTAANVDLELNGTTNGTVATAYIVAKNMLDCTQDSIAIRLKAGSIGDAETNQTDIDGELGIDSSGGRLYFRYGAAWHYCAITAGVQVPAGETACPKCHKAMKVGDALVTEVDRVMEDGALHAVWKHAKC